MWFCNDSEDLNTCRRDLEAAQKELKAKTEELEFFKSSIAKLKKLHMDEGAMELEIKNSPEISHYVASCFAHMVIGSPNYTECKFDVVHKEKESAEWITVLIKKGNGKTPHELRQEAENKAKKYENCLKAIRASIQGIWDEPNLMKWGDLHTDVTLNTLEQINKLLP